MKRLDEIFASKDQRYLINRIIKANEQDLINHKKTAHVRVLQISSNFILYFLKSR